MNAMAEASSDQRVAAVIDAVKCPDCSAERGDPCVYMPVVTADEYSWRPSVKAKLARVGTPTKRPHLGRWDAHRKMVNRRARAALGRQRVAAQQPDPELIAAHRAGVAFDRQEYLHLAQWLELWGADLFASLDAK